MNNPINPSTVNSTVSIIELKKLRKEKLKAEIKENREELKRIGFFKFFIEPAIDEWKKNPLKQIGIFLMWVFIFYTGASMAQAIYYDTVYCDASHDEYDGKMMKVYNGFVAAASEKIAEENKFRTANPFMKEDELVSILRPEKFEIRCGHDFGRWFNEKPIDNAKDILSNLKEILLFRFEKYNNYADGVSN